MAWDTLNVLDKTLVVIVAHNSAHDLAGVLESLPAACEDHPYQVVLVDNGSSDGTADLAEASGLTHVIRQGNVGYAAGINRGARESADWGFLLILNPDTRLLPGSVTSMKKTMMATGAGLVVPQVRTSRGTLSYSLRRNPTLLRALGLARLGSAAFSEHISEPEAYSDRHPVDWALGAVMLVSRRCFDELDGWDTSYFLYSEETDFCLRAWERGFATWFEPSAHAIHDGGGSGRNGWTHSLQSVNRVRLYGRWHSTPATYIYWFLTVLAELSWAIRGQRVSWSALRALCYPPGRPIELLASDRLLPR